MRVAIERARVEPRLREKRLHALEPLGAMHLRHERRKGLVEKRADRHTRIERRKRILEHNLNGLAEIPGPGRRGRHGSAFKHHGAGNRKVGRQEPERSHGGRGLAAAGLPDQGERFAAAKLKGNIADEGLAGLPADEAAPGHVDRQMLGRKDRRGSGRFFGRC